MHHDLARKLVLALLLIVAALAMAQSPAQSPVQDTVRFEVAEIPGAFTFAGPVGEVRQELVSMNEDMLVGYAFDVPMNAVNP